MVHFLQDIFIRAFLMGKAGLLHLKEFIMKVKFKKGRPTAKAY